MSSSSTRRIDSVPPGDAAIEVSWGTVVATSDVAGIVGA
jgi:hypothetical protein